VSLYSRIKEDYTDDFINAVFIGSDEAIKTLANMLEKTMKEKCPVVSGDLKESIYSQYMKDGAEVGAGDTKTKDYLRIIEYKQHPFMRLSGLAVRRIARRIIIENQIDAVLKGKARGKRKKK